MIKRAIVYARVSTDDQADRGYSLSAQVEAGRKYADVHGFTVTSELIDDGVAGALAFSERPAGATAWTMLRQHQADVLIVQNVDRLSRDVVNLLVTIRELLRAGVEVHCLDLGRVTSEYDIMLVIRGWQGSDEREKIRTRSIRGKRQKALEGKIVVCGRPTYGYDFLRDDKGRVVNFTVNDEQAEVVRLIFEWYTQGDGESGPLPQREVAKRLTAAGIPTSRSTRRTRQAWTPSTLLRILRNPAYKGLWIYRTTNPDNSEAEEFTSAIPPIIDADTWELAQIQRERNSRKARRNGKYNYLFTGIIQCGCGYSMTGHTRYTDSTKEKPYYYYYCNQTVNYFSGLEERECFEKSIREGVLAAAVWDVMTNIITNPAEFKEKLLEAQQVELEDQKPKQAELTAVESLIVEAESEAAQLATAITKATGLVEKVLQDKITALNERYEALRTRKNELEAALANRRLTDETIDELIQFAANFKTGIDRPSNKDMRQVLDTFDARVIVKDGGAKLELGLPEPTSIELRLPLISKSAN
ncbi:MAG TPA: recombinase family protein [Anaerolineae bacterium]|nr:recombinase family protein [Anaerolineae bacterium]